MFWIWKLLVLKRMVVCFEILAKLILDYEKSLHPLFALYFSLFSPIVWMNKFHGIVSVYIVQKMSTTMVYLKLEEVLNMYFFGLLSRW
jgi:hypothetical protein